MSLQKEKIVARNRDHLRQIVFESIEKYGPNCDLNFIDVSQVTDMYCISSGPNSVFNGDISGWNFSKDVCVFDMFYGSLMELKGRPLEWCKNLEEKWQKNHPPVSNEELDDDLPF